MAEHRNVSIDEDPVCGMTVDPEQARAKGLAITYEGHEYAFCGKGCFLDFRDDPQPFLEPGYAASM